MHLHACTSAHADHVLQVTCFVCDCDLTISAHFLELCGQSIKISVEEVYLLSERGALVKRELIGVDSRELIKGVCSSRIDPVNPQPIQPEICAHECKTQEKSLQVGELLDAVQE